MGPQGMVQIIFIDAAVGWVSGWAGGAAGDEGAHPGHQSAGGWVGGATGDIGAQILAIREQAGMQRICLLSPAEFPAVHFFPTCTCTHSSPNRPHLYATDLHLHSLITQPSTLPAG